MIVVVLYLRWFFTCGVAVSSRWCCIFAVVLYLRAVVLYLCFFYRLDRFALLLLQPCLKEVNVVLHLVQRSLKKVITSLSLMKIISRLKPRSRFLEKIRIIKELIPLSFILILLEYFTERPSINFDDAIEYIKALKMQLQKMQEKMKQLSDNLPEGSIDKPGPDDIFSKVMGKDRNGDAVMYGLGVRAYDVWGVIPSRSACRRENNELKSRCEELTSTVEQLRAHVSKMKWSKDSSSVLTLPHSPVVTNEPPCLRLCFYYKSLLFHPLNDHNSTFFSY